MVLGYAGDERGSQVRLLRRCFGKSRLVLPAWRSLVLLPPLLFAQPFARQGLLGAPLFTRLHVITVLLDFLDDVFLLHFTLETAQGIFQGLTFLNADFSHLKITILPMHVAMITDCY